MSAVEEGRRELEEARQQVTKAMENGIELKSRADAERGEALAARSDQYLNPES